MGSYPYEPTSTFSQEDQYQDLDFSDQTTFDHQNSSGFFKKQDSWPKNSIHRRKNQVFLQGYVETPDEDELVRSKSLTDEDLDELKGCLDLGFGFSYDEIPELCNTLPALELCYSMSQKFLDEHQKSPESPSSAVVDETASPPPIANWKISSPGDHPEDVKARLKYWAQAVACTVRLCN
ncbi:uncharacterized protein LOC112521587 [Cynara cardunculus var. scolymus]|uniref:Uncharacterized protein n=1 Tax=Cynara cardunculus var. scolymus TaxID=59895 RepID=A0A103YFT0_CYNCS|nr:uncharacterized protein LOC112521587 [Cynara cardunculus var. scolymus]KVI08286.1 Protein of unknown function DUF1685 [Cynara cardunculus var. scolymus]